MRRSGKGIRRMLPRRAGPGLRQAAHEVWAVLLASECKAVVRVGIKWGGMFCPFGIP